MVLGPLIFQPTEICGSLFVVLSFAPVVAHGRLKARVSPGRQHRTCLVEITPSPSVSSVPE